LESADSEHEGREEKPGLQYARAEKEAGSPIAFLLFVLLRQFTAAGSLVCPENKKPPAHQAPGAFEFLPTS
jgi:hypothetical protein